jgi:uncharacterized protein
MMCDISPCGGGRRFFATAANGDAYPCGEFIGRRDFFGGNILKDSIENIRDSKNFLKLRKRVVEDIEECRECMIRNICGAPCPAEIHSTEGSMYRKSYYCDFYKQVAQHAFEVIYREDVGHVIRKSAFKQRYALEV